MHTINFLIFFLSLCVTGYVIMTYGYATVEQMQEVNTQPTFTDHRLSIYAHIIASTIALTVGPFLFWRKLRTSQIQLHRWLGRLYLAGVAIGGLAGLNLSIFTSGGFIARLGFTCLSLMWIYSGLRAYLAIRTLNINAHYHWMIQNFSLTFAGVTLRLWLFISAMLGISFDTAYPIMAWFCWIPNILIASVLFKSQLGKSQSVLMKGGILFSFLNKLKTKYRRI